MALMTTEEKLNMLKAMLEDDTPEDALLTVYLTAAGKEILAWRYSYAPHPDVTEVPEEYEMTQIFAVVEGFSHGGSEGQIVHSENGISRTFKYEDMISYIRGHVIPYCKIM